jgi:hypothetical protein
MLDQSLIANVSLQHYSVVDNLKSGNCKTCVSLAGGLF